MNNLYNRIIKRLAVEHLEEAFNNGFDYGVVAGNKEARREIVKRLESLEIEKFNNTGVTLGYSTALELVKDNK